MDRGVRYRSRAFLIGSQDSSPPATAREQQHDGADLEADCGSREIVRSRAITCGINDENRSDVGTSRNDDEISQRGPTGRAAEFPARRSVSFIPISPRPLHISQFFSEPFFSPDTGCADLGHAQVQHAARICGHYVFRYREEHLTPAPHRISSARCSVSSMLSYDDMPFSCPDRAAHTDSPTDRARPVNFSSMWSGAPRYRPARRRLSDLASASAAAMRA